MHHPPTSQADAAALRPSGATAQPLERVAELTGGSIGPGQTGAVTVSGLSIDSRSVQPGDLYAALPGATAHGADYAAGALERGAAAVLTDPDGAQRLARAGLSAPVVVVDAPREHVGAIAARLYAPAAGQAEMPLFAVTGTNGKTTTTYFVNSIQRALGRTTGLIGTIEILAGDQRIPSRLTTPEAPTVHALLAVMREAGMTGASMEVSSHAIAFHRVDGVRFDVAGFTNLTQDHLDLHGSMEEYFEAKARLLTPEHTRRAVTVVQDDDDAWGIAMARRARAALGVENVDVVALRGGVVEDQDGSATRRGADWTLASVRRQGIGHRFELRHRDGRRLRVGTGLPGDFNVANAALAALMVLASGVELETLQRVLDEQDPLTTDVPGRMQLIGTEPTAVVDFAHNPDALRRALEAVDVSEGRVIVVFGATGDRDRGKRPLMGRIAAEGADIVIISDDDAHTEDPEGIREAVRAGAQEAVDAGSARAEEIQVISPRSVAIRAAVALARPEDSILLAGRGHETEQDIGGEHVPIDDREELRAALAQRETDATTPEGRWA